MYARFACSRPVARPTARSFAALARAGLLSLAFALGADVALAQRDLKDIPPPDPELQRKTFEVCEGFEASLFAADPLLAKPIQINFDAAGRMWVASSSVYPQIKPGQEATDKIVVLEDSDHDGKADKTTVFADGLLIPTGVEPGFGGAFVANSTELVHFEDLDGDGKADKKRVVLSGFGTEDTHHIIHTFRWGPDGAMYFNQSIYIHSHVETPWGVRRLGGGGIWRFRPDDLRMEVLCKGMVNSWGHDFDDFGQSWATDGAGFQGIHYIIPGATYFAFPNTKREFAGLHLGHPKYCGLEIVGGTHLPDDWQGDLITNDFRAHRVCRFKVADEGAGYTATQMPDVIRSNHVAFRPVDVKLGPDGAIYIADWYNPIIQHGEVDFRDPRRDLVHGRIWRIAAKGRPAVKPPKLVEASDAELVNSLVSPDPWTRRFARRVLVERSSKPAWVASEAAAGEPIAERRVNSIEIADLITESDKRAFASSADRDKFRLELLWLAESIQKGPFASEVSDLVRTLLRSETPQIRAAATRVLTHELERFPDALTLLAGLVDDPYPRVRLEAVRALGRIPKVEAAQLALRALDHPMDKFVEYALWLTVDELAPVWSPKLKSGELTFDDPAKLEYLVTAAPSAEVMAAVVGLVNDAKLSDERRNRLLAVLAGVGGPNELKLVFDRAVTAAQAKDASAAALFDAVAQAVRRRKTQPAGDAGARWSSLEPLAASDVEAIKVAAIKTAGALKIQAAGETLASVAQQENASPAVATAALESLAELGGAAAAQLGKLAESGPAARRARAAAALASIDLGRAAKATADLLGAAAPGEYDPSALVGAIVRTKDGPATLARALEGKSLNADVAKLAVRSAASIGDAAKPLEQALRKAGKLDDPRPLPTPEEVAALVAEARASGDPARGEAIFRRKNLQCLQCHAIGGAGGRVGPDVTTIGASAQPDYLVDSLLDPNKQVKENFNAIICETVDGRVITGLKVRQNDQELIIRTAEDRDVVIPAGDVDSVTVGKSLMPAGLVDPLTRGELVDLIRFLSELGKPGPYGPAPAPVIRRWKVLENTPQAKSVAREAPSYKEAAADPRLTWSAVYSTVDGSLPIAEYATAGPWFDTKQFAWYQAEVDVETAGAIAVKLNSPEGLRVYVDGQSTDAAKLATVDLPQGRHVLTFAVDRGSRPAPLRVEVAPAAGSAARVVPVGGK